MSIATSFVLMVTVLVVILAFVVHLMIEDTKRGDE